MAAEPTRTGDFREKAKDAKDLLELLARLEAKLEAAIADTRARRIALQSAPRATPRQD